MKKTLTFIVLFVLTSILMISCVPDPQEIQPLCRDLYSELLDVYPGYPPSFVGFCVATLQAGKPVAYQGVCGSEAFWLSMPELFDEGLVITSRQECINYFKSLE